MAEVTLPNTLTAGEPASAAEVMANLNAIVAQVNGNLDATNLDAGVMSADQIAEAVAALLGVSTTVGGVRRGKSIITTEETITPGATYSLMTTPDRVSNVVLPTDGLIVVAFQGVFSSSVSGAGRAAIHVGANQLKVTEAPNPVVNEASSSGLVANALYTDGSGLDAVNAYGGDVTTGQVIRPIAIFAAAGTYDVSVKYKAASGTVTARDRKLWVRTEAF